MKGDTISIYFEWTLCNPEPVQFKPCNPSLHPIDLYVQIDVPKKYFVDKPNTPKGTLCLTKAGFEKIRAVLAGTDKF